MFVFLLRNLDGCTMTWGEFTFGFGVLYISEGVEIVALGKLVVAVHVAVVHEAPSATEEREHTRAFYGLVCYLAETWTQCPCLRSMQIGEGVLPDAFVLAGFGLEKQVIESVLVFNNIGIDGRLFVIEQ